VFSSDLQRECKIDFHKTKRNTRISDEATLDVCESRAPALEKRAQRVPDLPVHGGWGDEIDAFSDPDERSSLGLARENGHEGRSVDDRDHTGIVQLYAYESKQRSTFSGGRAWRPAFPLTSFPQ